MRVIGLHQKRPEYASQLNRFQNESKDFSALTAYVVNLPAYPGTRLATKATFLVWSYEAISKQVKRLVLLTCLGAKTDYEMKNLFIVYHFYYFLMENVTFTVYLPILSEQLCCCRA